MINNDEVTAEWARKTSQNILGEKVKKHIETCLMYIRSAVIRNDLSVDITIYVEELTLTELRKRGFTVTKHVAQDQREGDYITIKW